MTIIISIISLAAVFLLSTLVSLNMKYKDGHWLFEVFHLFAGFFVAMFWSGLIEPETIIVVATVAVGLLWEGWEFFRSRSPKLNAFLSKLNFKQGTITLTDTLLDLFLDIVGALIFILII